MPVKYTSKARDHSSWIDSATMDLSGPHVFFMFIWQTVIREHIRPGKNSGRNRFLLNEVHFPYDCTENGKTTDVQQWEQPRTVDWDDSLPFLKLCRFPMVKICSSLLHSYTMAHFHQSLWGFCLGKETRERKCQSQVRVAVMAGIFPVRSALQPSVSKSQNNPWTPLLESPLKSGSPQTKWHTSMASRFCLSNPVLYRPPSVLFSCSCSLSQNKILSCSVFCRTAMKTESEKHEYPLSCNGRH